MTIAGHTFPDDIRPRVCVCGRSWDYLVANRHLWASGAYGIAHIGALNERECEELITETVRIYDLVMGRAA